MWFDAPREVSGHLGEATDFTIDVMLTSAGHLGGYDASEDSPPMPFAFGSLGLYRLAHHYLLSDSQTGLSVTFGEPTDLTRVTIVQSHSPRLLQSFEIADGKAGIIVCVDGEPISHHEVISKFSNYVLGRGFQKRFWRGDIDHADFLPRALTKAPVKRAARLLGATDLLKSGSASGFPTV